MVRVYYEDLDDGKVVLSYNGQAQVYDENEVPLTMLMIAAANRLGLTIEGINA